IGRKEPADEMIPIEGAYALAADPAGHGGNVVEMRIVCHGGHGGVEIAGELGIHVALEQRHHGLLFGRQRRHLALLTWRWTVSHLPMASGMSYRRISYDCVSNFA